MQSTAKLQIVQNYKMIKRNMKKILEGKTRITTRNEFDLAITRIDELINEATDEGYFSDRDDSNEYTVELARLGKLAARYEDEFLNLSISRKPLIRKIEQSKKLIIFAS
jgi:hypothetical protein